MSLAIPAFEAANVWVTGDIMPGRYWSGPVSRIPDHLRGRYQSFTKDDIGALHKCPLITKPTQWHRSNVGWGERSEPQQSWQTCWGSANNASPQPT